MTGAETVERSGACDIGVEEFDEWQGPLPVCVRDHIIIQNVMPGCPDGINSFHKVLAQRDKTFVI